MRVSVDLARCQSYGQCVFFAPDVFELRDREVLEFDAAYGRAGRMIGAVAVDMPRSLDVYSALITARAPFPPQLNAPDAPSRIRAHPTAGPVDGSRAAVAAH